MRRARRPSRILPALLVLFCAACSGGGSSGTPSPGGSVDKTPVTITVWDYYGTATPFTKQALAGFHQQYPWITVNYQSLGWNATHDKFTVTVASGAGPDVATLDMTWIPTFASQGLLYNLTDLSGGSLNGQPIQGQYTPGALDAMTYNGNYVVMLSDFDAYALYYRADLFQQKHIQVPTTWSQLQTAAKQLATDTNGDGKPDKYLYQVPAGDCFHWCSYLFQNGGSILNSDGTASAFNDQSGLQAMEMYKSFLDNGTGIYWGNSEGDPMAGIKDGRIGMFEDGPYWMGLLKTGAPELSGDWKVAPAPYGTTPGSYLGGTGLGIPVNCKHPQQAWLFIQYMLQLKQQLGVAMYAGAAPATSAALNNAYLSEPDPYFGNTVPFQVFLKTMSTATHFPYVKQWDQVDTDIGNMVDYALLGKKTPQEALARGAQQVNSDLSSG